MQISRDKAPLCNMSAFICMLNAKLQFKNSLFFPDEKRFLVFLLTLPFERQMETIREHLRKNIMMSHPISLF